MTLRLRRIFVSASAALAFACGAATPAAADTAYGLTPVNQLIAFDTATPGTIAATVAITGLQPGETLLGIDIRPATSQIYGVGSMGRLYLVNPATGVATAVSTTPLALAGTSFGVDFNPTVDRLRLVSDTEQNIRINPNNGTLAGTDTSLNPAGNVVASAYTSNFSGATTTTLYGIDSASDQLVRQGGGGGDPSPNFGVLTNIGPLGVNTSAEVGFDIISNGTSNTAYASLTIGGVSGLYTINLASGSATLIGNIGAGLLVTGLAVTSPTAVTLYGVTGTNTLVSFNSAVPGTILSSVGIIGLQVGETVLGLDARPATSQLYALGSTGRLYTVDPASGQALPVGTTPIPLNGSEFGIDFNPTVDRLRVVSNAEQNLRIHPDTGAIAGTDTPLNPAGSVVGAAYTNNVFGATVTTLYGIDSVSDTLVRIGGIDGPPSPNLGVVTTVGPLGVDISGVLGFDIATLDGTAYAALHATGAARLFRINLATGAATQVGTMIGDGSDIRGLTAAFPGSVQFTSSTYITTENNPGSVTLTRTGSTAGPLAVDITANVGSATAGVDYTPLTTRIVLLNGEASRTITIPVLEDLLDEPDETVGVVLSNPGLGGLIGVPGIATLVIADNDGPNAVPTVTITSPTTDTLYPSNAPLISLAGTASDDGTLATVSWFTNRGASGTATGLATWSIANIPLFPGSNTITVRATDTAGSSGFDIINVTLDNLVYTLSEGATGTFFDLDVLLANPNPLPAPVTLAFLKEDGTTLTQVRMLPALSRTTVRVDDIAGLEAAALSTVVTSTNALPLVVERTMRWDPTGYGAHGEKATAGPALTWYFAEGSQGFFETFLLLANPGLVANTADVQFLLENGTVISASYPMAPTSRLSVPLNTIPALATQSFGITVTFAAPGLAERAMYFGQPLFNGGHASAGETAPATQWFLAEGATGSFFTTFLLLANPGNGPADVTLTYLPESGAAVTKNTSIPAKGRLTINVAGEDPTLAAAAFATRVQSTAPIVVERAQYWPGTPDQWYEAHNSFGLTALATHWGLAEGRIGGTGDAQTYILLANPGAVTATVSIKFLREPGRSPQTITKVVNVPATSRVNVTVGPGSLVPELSGETFGAELFSSQPIAVERAVYWNVNGQVFAAGTNATATRLP